MLNELISREVRVDRVTDKYIYSTEFLTYSKTDFFVACHAHERYEWAHSWRVAGYDCRVYDTQEEATAHFAETARVWDWDVRACYVKVVHTTELIVKKHRNKVRG